MNNKSDVLPEVLPMEREQTGRAPVHRIARMYLGYLALCLMCVGVSALAVVMRAVLPPALSRRLGRRLIAASFRVYLHVLTIMGSCKFDLSELDALRGRPAVIVAPNHPCLLDAIMILSRLPDASCIMKAGLGNNVFFGVGARLGGYIGSTPLRGMIQLAVADMHRGSHLLLFPEGTRTCRFPIDRLQGTTGLIAKRAGVKVQTVFIETSSGFLGKGGSLWRAPHMPVTYRVRLGKQFETPVDTAEFTLRLEEYFRCELAQAQLPKRAGSS